MKIPVTSSSSTRSSFRTRTTRCSVGFLPSLRPIIEKHLEKPCVGFPYEKPKIAVPKSRYTSKRIRQSLVKARYKARLLQRAVRERQEQLPPELHEKPSFAHTVKQWIVDSGASTDLVSRKHLSIAEQDGIVAADTCKHFETANGIINADDQVELTVKHTGKTLNANPYILDDCPAILSLGQRIRDGYQFYWTPSAPPLLIAPDGTHFELDVEDNVPVMNHAAIARCMVASSNAVGSAQHGGCTPSSTTTTTSPSAGSTLRDENPENSEQTDDKITSTNMRDVTKPSAEEESPLIESTGSQEEESPDVKADDKNADDSEVEKSPPGEIEDIDASHFITHFPKHPRCPVCSNCKIQRKHCRRVNHDPDEDHPKEFGESVTADHMIQGREEQSYRGDTVACVIMDRATGWIQAFPAKSKSAGETKRAFMKFLGDVKPKKIYTDGSGEFKAALEDLQYPHDVSTPHRPQTNGVAERANRRVIEGASCLLFQAGLPLPFWKDALFAFCALRNFFDKMNGKTSHEHRFGYKFKGLIIPFGAAVSYKPHGEDADALHKFGPRTRTGIFIGYYLHHGGKWSGDYLLYDLEKLTKATDFHHVHLVRVKEMIKPKSIEFPLANGSHSLLLGDDNNKRFHDVIKKKKNKNNENNDTQEVKTPAGESSESSEVKTPNDDDDIEAPSYEPDYWIVVGNSVTRVHRTPRKALYVPHPDDGCPVDLKYVDVMRHTTTDLDTVGEKDIEDVWVPHGNVIEGINAGEV